MEIKPGDVVFLKGGSFTMTVASVHGDLARVYWGSIDPKTERDDLFDEYLPLVMLDVATTIYPPPNSSPPNPD